MDPNEDLQALIERALKQWRDSLVELGRRNKLLNYRPTKSSTIEFSGLDPQVVFDAVNAGTYALGASATKASPALDDDHDESVEDLEAHIVDAFDESAVDGSAPLLRLERPRIEVDRCARNLRAAARRDFDERGLTTLYLAIGMLRWAEGNVDEYRSPLILVPVELHAATSRERPLIKIGEGDVVVNPVLALKLEEFGVVLPDGDEIAEVLLAEGVDAALAKFANLDRDLEWQVEPDAVLATFMFAKEAMYRDLQKNEARILDHPVMILVCSTRGSRHASQNLVDDPARGRPRTSSVGCAPGCA